MYAGVASKTLLSCASNCSSLAKDETFGPFLVTCNIVQKYDKKKEDHLKSS